MKRHIIFFMMILIHFLPGICLGNAEVTFLERTFVRAKGKTKTEAVFFQGNSGPAILKLTNGSPDDPNIKLVNNALVILNGEVVLRKSDFKKKVRALEKEIMLADGQNLLEVRLGSKIGSRFSIRIIQQFSSLIGTNTTWSGSVWVYGNLVVQPNVTLAVLPGTRVEFKHYRGYREPEKRLQLFVYGQITAAGTADKPIYFTSDAPQPQNGDWSMLRLETPSGPCVFQYCVFELAQQGLRVWQGNVVVSHCVFRWNNWEGIYFESHSQGNIDYSQSYENGYNGLAAEQFNTILMDYCEFWRNGTHGMHVDASSLEIRRSLVHENQANGLSLDDNGALRAYGVASFNNRHWGIGFGEGANTCEVSNLTFSGNGVGMINGPYTEVTTSYFPPASIDLGFVPDQSYALGYIPGDPLLDKYMYVYPDDETRRIVRKIGAGIPGMTWSLAWDGLYIWTATLTGKIYQLDPVNGNVIKQFNAPGPQPWGMTFDGSHLWLVDFAEKRISKIDPSSGQELLTFPTPDPVGGCKGIAWDGTYLNIMGWTSPTIYRMDRTGNLIGTIQLDCGGAGGIAWDGSHFWIPAGRIIKYDTSGHAVGWIYPASEGTWDLDYDGQYLWASQRTNETWLDAKIFALEVLAVQPF